MTAIFSKSFFVFFYRPMKSKLSGNGVPFDCWIKNWTIVFPPKQRGACIVFIIDRFVDSRRSADKSTFSLVCPLTILTRCKIMDIKWDDLGLLYSNDSRQGSRNDALRNRKYRARLHDRKVRAKLARSSARIRRAFVESNKLSCYQPCIR